MAKFTECKVHCQGEPGGEENDNGEENDGMEEQGEQVGWREQVEEQGMQVESSVDLEVPA
jgi:hypothetical protein